MIGDERRGIAERRRRRSLHQAAGRGLCPACAGVRDVQTSYIARRPHVAVGTRDARSRGLRGVARHGE